MGDYRHRALVALRDSLCMTVFISDNSAGVAFNIPTSYFSCELSLYAFGDDKPFTHDLCVGKKA